jgi:hypothetical protein
MSLRHFDTLRVGGGGPVILSGLLDGIQPAYVMQGAARKWQSRCNVRYSAGTTTLKWEAFVGIIIKRIC